MYSFFERDYLKEFIKKESHQEQMNNKLFKPLVKLEKIPLQCKNIIWR
jgi:hypothetical protein